MRLQSRLSLLCIAAVAVMLLACGAADDADKKDQGSETSPAKAADSLIDWKISWAPATTRVDKTSIKVPPTYQLEMASDETSEDWKVVWTGTTTTAQFRAPPGHHCFRAVTIEKDSRSDPSAVICATKEGASAG